MHLKTIKTKPMKKENDISRAALAGLMEAERPRLLRYACYRLGNREDAEDAVQDAFLRLHHRLQPPGEPAVKAPRNYLFRALANLCATRLAQKARQRTLPLTPLADRAAPQRESFEEEFRRLSGLMALLPDEQAEVIRLRIYGENSFAAIADILSLPLPTVKSRFLYGLDKIRRGMKSTEYSLKTRNV